MSKPFEANYREGQAFWQVDILWVILAEGKDTDNNYSMMWELCPKDSGPPPHYHDQDEGFFVTDGQVTYVANGQQLVAKEGSFVWIPRGTVHSFRVDSETATLLNFYTPAGFERTITEAAQPAGAFALPPKGLGMRLAMPDLMKLFKEVGMHVVDQPDTLRQH